VHLRKMCVLPLLGEAFSVHLLGLISTIQDLYLSLNFHLVVLSVIENGVWKTATIIIELFLLSIL
jgi:hypothetical protein